MLTQVLTEGVDSMRIDSMSQVAQIYKTTQAQRTEKTQKAKAKDEVQISEAGKDFQIAKMALQEVPDVREDKIAAIKSSMEAGTYEVNSSSFADKVIQKYTDILGY